jgi:hypothetical protein
LFVLLTRKNDARQTRINVDNIKLYYPLGPNGSLGTQIVYKDGNGTLDVEDHVDVLDLLFQTRTLESARDQKATQQSNRGSVNNSSIGKAL